MDKPLTERMKTALRALGSAKHVPSPGRFGGDRNVFEALCRRDLAVRTRVHDPQVGGWGQEVYQITAEGAEALEALDEGTPVVVEVERIVCGHNVRLGEARVAEGPAYVVAHLDQKDLGALCAALVEGGHAFAVRHVDRHVSILEFMGASAAEVAAFDERLKAP